MDNENKWFYADRGEQIGPISFDEIKKLAVEAKISQETKVWSGQGDWQFAKNTVLANFFKKEGTVSVNLPPPLVGNDIDNRYIWAVVAVPIIGSMIETVVGKNLILFYIIANIVFCILDEKKLKKAGQHAPSNWMTFIVPVYLWQRASLLKQKRYYFIAWCATFVLSTAIAAGGHKDALADAACPVVDDILLKKFYSSAKCKKVKIKKEVSDGFYQATAILDNGNELSISIEEKDDQIYVRIPSNQ